MKVVEPSTCIDMRDLVPGNGFSIRPLPKRRNKMMRWPRLLPYALQPKLWPAEVAASRQQSWDQLQKVADQQRPE